MNNEANRLAQIIGRAADKYRGLAGLLPTKQDKAAALAIEAEYLLIRRDELPKAEIVDHGGVPHVEVGSNAWSCKTASPDYAKSEGLAYFAASIAIQQWHDDTLTRRRDELARQFANDKTNYNNGISPALQAAINHIIELEGKAA